MKKIKFPSNGDYKKLLKKLQEAQFKDPFQSISLDCLETKSVIHLHSPREISIYIDALLMCWQIRPKDE